MYTVPRRTIAAAIRLGSETRKLWFPIFEDVIRDFVLAMEDDSATQGIVSLCGWTDTNTVAGNSNPVDLGPGLKSRVWAGPYWSGGKVEATKLKRIVDAVAGGQKALGRLH